jgi:hypothetical protein
LLQPSFLVFIFGLAIPILWNFLPCHVPEANYFLIKLKILPMMHFYSLRHSGVTSMKTILFSFFFSLIILKTSAQAGNALQYTGTGNNISNGLPNQQYLQLPAGIVQGINGAFTIEAWVNWSSTGLSAWQRIFDFGTGTSDFMFLTPSSNTNQVRFAIVQGATVETVDASIQLPTNAWTHVAVSIDNTNTGRIFINGVLQGTATFNLRPASLGNTTQNYLGKSQFLPDPYFNGVIDELRISNVARYTSSFTPQTTEFTTDANTVALFHFNEGSGQTTTAVGGSLVGTLGFSTASEPDLDPTWVTNSILPVRIESFTAQKQGTTVDLKWQANTTGEGGSFIVERSTDNRAYENIAVVNMKDMSGSFGYSFKDKSPAKAKNYYRLKIVENNATPKWSTVVWVDMNGEGLFTITPSLTSTSLFVNAGTETRLTIYNISGTEVMNLSIPGSQNIDVSNLGKGMYFVRFDSGQTAKFIKQ